MSEATENRELSISLNELRDATLAITDALRDNEAVNAIDQDKLPLVHAYMFGVVMRAAGMTPSSLLPLIDFMKLGYEDYQHMKQRETRQ
jgi:hypothetical protein